MVLCVTESTCIFTHTTVAECSFQGSTNSLYLHLQIHTSSIEGPPVRFLFWYRLGFCLLTAHFEESGTALLLPPLQVRAVRAAAGPLHVRDLGLILHAVGVHGKQVLSSGLLPVHEGSRLE